MSDITSCDNCTDPRTFPQPFESISLTNFVEIVKVDDLYYPVKNKFEMIRHTSAFLDLKSVAAGFGAIPSLYDPYLSTRIIPPTVQPETPPPFKLTLIPWHTYLAINSTYFLINKKWSGKSIRDLQRQIWQIWLSRAGSNGQSSVYSKKSPIRFPYIMPSRNMIFR